ncbi:DUF6300 family protein [Streptomyces mirabilis]|uniref:DUF6300 family protein n=1 Tax=Streptomyces mirabilis TaxID=68239 RepID=UPI00331A89B6
MTTLAEAMRPIELKTTNTPPVCPGCNAPVLLVARYPSAWCNQSGKRIDGFKESVLCRRCDTNNPAAGRLLALFNADGELSTVADGEAFGELVCDWVNSVRHRTPNLADLDSEEARWRADEL